MSEEKGAKMKKKSFPWSQIRIPCIKYCIFTRIPIFLATSKTLIFQILFHCLKSKLLNIQIRAFLFEFNINIVFSQQQTQSQRQLQVSNFPDHSMKYHSCSLWWENPTFGRGSIHQCLLQTGIQEGPVRLFSGKMSAYLFLMKKHLGKKKSEVNVKNLTFWMKETS